MGIYVYGSYKEREQNEKLKGKRFTINAEGAIVINSIGDRHVFKSVDDLCYYVEKYFELKNTIKQIHKLCM